MPNYHFTNHQLLGQGGFSDVYHATNSHDGQTYAIKTFRLPTSPEDRQRVLRYYRHEAQALTHLSHPNIVTCIDHYVQESGDPIIIMAPIEGISLRQYIDEQGVVEASVAHSIALQVAQALSACHSPEPTAIAQGVKPLVHNDLHPRNILCTPAPTPSDAPHCTLIDFGLSFPIGHTLTLWEKEQGLKEYKAPEKWTHDTLTPATDIYAYGALLYALFTGCPPFVCTDYSDSTAEDVLRKQCLTAPPPHLWALRADLYDRTYGYAPSTPDIPYWWQQIAERCLSKDPALRYATATELLADIAKGEADLLPTAWPAPRAEAVAPTTSPTLKATTPSPTSVAPEAQAPTPPPIRPLPPKPSVAPPSPHTPAPRKGRGCSPLVIIVLILLTALMSYGIVHYWTGYKKERQYTELIQAYYEDDTKTMSEASLDQLIQHFDFPIYYYTKRYDTKAEFRKFYLKRLRDIQKKTLRIDRISVEETQGNYTMVRMEGEFTKVDRDGKVITTAVRDVLRINNATKQIYDIRRD